MIALTFLPFLADTQHRCSFVRRLRGVAGLNQLPPSARTNLDEQGRLSVPERERLLVRQPHDNIRFVHRICAFFVH